jgi:hypothetical protein
VPAGRRVLKPRLNSGVYVFCQCERIPDGCEAVFVFREREGITVVRKKSEAEALGLDSTYPCAWITLDVDSKLTDVGLLASVTAALASAGLSVNAVSAYSHDHLFVEISKGPEALEILSNLSSAI